MFCALVLWQIQGVHCVFFEDFKIFRTLASLCFPSVSVCVHQRCSKTGRVQKSHKILRKNKVFDEHPVRK